MDIKVEKMPKSQIKVTVTLNEADTQKYLEKAAKQVSEMVNVPGFRKGNVPLDVLKKHVKEGAIEAHMIDLAIPDTYSEAVKNENLQVVSRPKVEIKKQDPLTYDAIVAIYPEVKISGHDKIKIKEEKVELDKNDVENVLKDIEKRHATYVKVDREAKKGDRVEIDFEGFDEGGASLENTSSKHHPVIIGDGMLVKDFEENLVGVKKSEDKEFTVTFPKDYFHKPFQGKKVKFRIHVHEVEEVKVPEWTPEFIKEITGKEKQLDEVKKDIETNLLEEKKHGVKVKMENEFLDKIAELTKVEIPDALIEEEVDGMIDEMKSEMESKGIPFAKYLEDSKKTIEDLKKQRLPEAEKRLTLRFGLQELFKEEGMDVSEEDVKKEMEHMIELYPDAEKEKVRQEYKDNPYLSRRLENKLKMDKLFAKYLYK